MSRLQDNLMGSRMSHSTECDKPLHSTATVTNQCTHGPFVRALLVSMLWIQLEVHLQLDPQHQDQLCLHKKARAPG
jgi:hypothetical protein